MTSMINAIDNALEVVRKAARDQSDSIVHELNADFDARNVALATYNDAMKQAKALRQQADSIEREAHDALNSALTSSGGVALAMINQINQGQMVAASELPSLRFKATVKE
jgi:outer membrane protein assembly factor BamE (lipoprotein component of BamABCDE complex)